MKVTELKVDRTKFSVGSLDDKPDEIQYWLSKSPAERWQAIEIMRQIVYGYDPATTRFQIFVEVADLT